MELAVAITRDAAWYACWYCSSRAASSSRFTPEMASRVAMSLSLITLSASRFNCAERVARPMLPVMRSTAADTDVVPPSMTPAFMASASAKALRLSPVAPALLRMVKLSPVAGAPPIATLDDLAGQEVFVRKGSIYEESLVRLNGQLKARGKPAVVIDEAPDVLEDDDVLEMVNAGLVPITVVDDYLAGFWSKVFTGIKVHSDLAVRSGGSLAVAFRKENPKLREVVDAWLRKHPKGDGFRNTIERRYLDSAKYAKNAAADAERQKFAAVIELFKK